jgi:hypothetical protein
MDSNATNLLTCRDSDLTAIHTLISKTPGNPLDERVIYIRHEALIALENLKLSLGACNRIKIALHRVLFWENQSDYQDLIRTKVAREAFQNNEALKARIRTI